MIKKFSYNFNINLDHFNTIFKNVNRLFYELQKQENMQGMREVMTSLSRALLFALFKTG